MGYSRLDGDESVLEATSYEHLQGNVGSRMPLTREDWWTGVRFFDDLAVALPGLPEDLRSAVVAPLIVNDRPYGSLNLTRSGLGGTEVAVNVGTMGELGPAWPAGSAKADAIYEWCCAQIHSKVQASSGADFGYNSEFERRTA